MERLLVAVVIVALAVVVAEIVRRRRPADAPTQPAWQLPVQIDRADFAHPDRPWLVVVFSSATCSTCADVKRKAAVLVSDEVGLADVPYQDHRALHEKYGIEAVPGVVVAGPDGAVHAQFLGPVSATDLWAAVAEARQPGSVHGDGGTCSRHAAE
jgi:hypothetical protein